MCGWMWCACAITASENRRGGWGGCEGGGVRPAVGGWKDLQHGLSSKTCPGQIGVKTDSEPLGNFKIEMFIYLLLSESLGTNCRGLNEIELNLLLVFMFYNRVNVFTPSFTYLIFPIFCFNNVYFRNTMHSEKVQFIQDRF